jgi:tRNA-5-methyluridine54 2-sulfurtransferase
MRCKKCGATAVINMRQHKLALCELHYVDWFRAQTERFIGKYRMFAREERVLIAVSGGKDSLALWDVLLALGYEADGLYIDLGIDGGLDYSKQSLTRIEGFLAGREGGALHVADIAGVYGATVPEAARLTRRGRAKPCAVCGLVKRHVMNRVARDGGYDVLATGHNLDDEAAVLFGNTLNWQVGYLARQAPVLPASADGLARKVKPFFRFYERETAAYALVRGIDYLDEECPFSVGATSIRHKMTLNEMETDSPGLKLQFYLSFLRAKEAGAWAGMAEARPVMEACERCGQPTTVGPVCAFCRLWEGGTTDDTERG